MTNKANEIVQQAMVLLMKAHGLMTQPAVRRRGKRKVRRMAVKRGAVKRSA